MERNPEQIVTWISWRAILFSPSQVLKINFYTQRFILFMKGIQQTDVIWVAGAVLSKLLWFLDPGNHSPISILIVSMTNLPVRHRHHSQDRHSLLNIFGSFQSPSPPGSKPKHIYFLALFHFTLAASPLGFHSHILLLHSLLLFRMKVPAENRAGSGGRRQGKLGQPEHRKNKGISNFQPPLEASVLTSMERTLLCH